MPITKQAEKKLRHDKHITRVNMSIRKKVRMKIKTFRSKPDKKTLPETYSALDKAVKNHTIHKNKAARLKSRLAKMLIKK